MLMWKTFTTDVGQVQEQRHHMQGDHPPDNVKFPDSSQHSSAALGMLSVTHIMPVLVLNYLPVWMQICSMQ